MICKYGIEPVTVRRSYRWNMSSSRIHIVAASLPVLIARAVTLRVSTSDMHFTMAKSAPTAVQHTRLMAPQTRCLHFARQCGFASSSQLQVSRLQLCLPLSAFTSLWSPAIQLCDRSESAKVHDRPVNSHKRDVEAKDTSINHQLPRSHTVNHLR
jgi:hypothetical protein